MPEAKLAGEPWRAPEQAGDGGTTCNVVTRPWMKEEMVGREKEEEEQEGDEEGAADRLEKKAKMNERGRSRRR